MRLIGNILWVIFGGLVICLEYVIGALILCLTIVGIPFGFQCLKLAILALWPFGRVVVDAQPPGNAALALILNVIWLIFAGIWICLTHLVFVLLFGITIIGIPFALQHMKLAQLSLTPFGKEVR